MLAPLDIYGKKFNKGFRGYEQNEVDDFLKTLVNDYETLYNANIELKEREENLKNKLEQYKQLEKTMQNTLMVAQTTAEEIKTNALKEKEVIIKEAETIAEKIISDAQMAMNSEKQKHILEINNAKTACESIKKTGRTSLAKLRNLLETELKILIEDNFYNDFNKEDVFVDNNVDNENSLFDIQEENIKNSNDED